MTETSRVPDSATRDVLRARIDAAERRNAERSIADQARDAASAAVDYTRANPLTVIGGALAVGLVIGLLTRPGRRVAGRALHGTADAISGAASGATSGAKKLATRGGSRFGALIGEAALAYIMTVVDEVLENAREGKERAGELSEATEARARKLSAQASQAAGSAAESTRALARQTRDAALDVVRSARRRTKG